MKFINRKKDEVELIWGNRYRLKEGIGGIKKSDIVVLLSSEKDSDSEVRVISKTKNSATWVTPEYLQEIDQATLEEITREDNTFLVEINQEELKILECSVSYLRDIGYDKFSSENKVSILLRDIKELLTMMEINSL